MSVYQGTKTVKVNYSFNRSADAEITSSELAGSTPTTCSSGSEDLVAVHNPGAVVDFEGAKGGYVHRPICSCGWRYGVRYASFFAAMIVAEDHARTEEVVVMP